MSAGNMNEKRPIVEKIGSLAVGNEASKRKHLARRHLFQLAITTALLVIICLILISGYVQKWLWMQQLGYVDIFRTLLSVKWAMSCSAFLVAFLYLWINLRQAGKDSATFQTGVRTAKRGLICRSQ
jgi:uncharacterized membrane protein (UPF0182 family)